MARPFRFQPPARPEPVLPRTRLAERMTERWANRLLTVVAGPGFGKTVLLASVLGDDDRWLSCEPADESAEHLVSGLAAAAGLPPDTTIETLVEWVWSQTPRQLCFVIDDVHEVPTDSDGAGVLKQLVADLPANGHVVLGSRDAVPVPTARLGAARQLVRINEDELLLDADELADLARLRDADAALVAASGGWPALAELIASTGADLVLDYLWEEVLDRVGTERARLLAGLDAVGGGDDDVATALAGKPTRVDDLVASVPLVQRAESGWVALHPLWGPALRRLLTDDDAAETRRRVAAAHRASGRLSQSFELYAEADAWDDALAVIRDAAVAGEREVRAVEVRRWSAALPHDRRDAPEAQLAAGVELSGASPLDALGSLEAAAAGFRGRGDTEAELAAIALNGLVRWWANDLVGLLGLYERVDELANGGSASAQMLRSVALAAIAHIGGDSATVLAELADVDDRLTPGWLPNVHWLRSVAHRRNGDLDRAVAELDAANALLGGRSEPQLAIARLRADWLRGDVERVHADFAGFATEYQRSNDRFLAAESGLELAGKAGWLGQLDAGREHVAAADRFMPDAPGALARILRVIAVAAVAVGEGDEAGAAALLRDAVLADLAGAEAWYWRDRAAIALTYVLVPETRDLWPAQPLGVAHKPGLVLAEALLAARNGDLAPVAALDWPASGVVRAHLPLRWVIELAVAGRAAANPPPVELLAAVEPTLRSHLRALTEHPVIGGAAKELLSATPALPGFRLRINALGPLELQRDGEPVTHRELRRARVRELLSYLVANPRARREAVADELWPDIDNPGPSLRTTLSYLQRVLQPDRAEGDAPYFVRSDSTWLSLDESEHLEVDVWELDTHLAAADAAEKAGAPTAALAAYRAALPLWRGEPFADAPFAPWAEGLRTRLRLAYVAAALRAGELFLSSGAFGDAKDAATRAITAEPTSEPAYRLLLRALLTAGDEAGARRALDDLRRALAELDIEPDSDTVALLNPRR